MTVVVGASHHPTGAGDIHTPAPAARKSFVGARVKFAQSPGGNVCRVYSGNWPFSRRQVGNAAMVTSRAFSTADFCGCLIRWSTTSRVNSVQEPARGFSYRFKVVLSWVLGHAEQHDREALKCPSSVMKRSTR